MIQISNRHTKLRSLLPLGFAILLLAVPTALSAQTLDDAVNSQLKVSPVLSEPVACGILVGTDNAVVVLEGGLKDICTRGVAGGPGPGSGASGGGAATPATLPGIIERRLEEVGEENSGAGASAEVVTMMGSRTSLFFSAEYEYLDRVVTTFEDGYDSDLRRLAAGADYRVNDRALIGAAVEGYNHEGDYTEGGHFEIDALGLLLFGVYSPVDASFLQFSLGLMKKSNDRIRRASFTSELGTLYPGRPSADFDADEYQAGILAGYDYSSGPYTLSSHLGLDWLRNEYDNYSEEGDSGLELTFHDDEVNSLQSTLGVQGSMAVSTNFGVVLPQISLDWKYEFDNDQRDVQVSFVGDTRAKRFIYQTEPPDRNFFELNAGVSFVLPHGVQAFANYRTLLSHSFFDSNAVTIGIRVEL